ncbi:MAG: glutamyl-tRNA reductase [Arcobacter sp.]|nr:glutamyl-tRNA reductase [Arcobacter sp.]
MSYLIISFSHKNTDIEMREKLSFNSDEKKEEFIKKILKNQITKEVVLLSTCNRVEVITRTVNVKFSAREIIEILSKYSSIDFDTLHNRADIYDNDGAIHHLFSVASALDSLVIGETQIVGQLKDAFRFSQARNFCDVHLTRAMHFAFKCAAAVRTATNLGTGSVSISSTAVAKAKEVLGNINGVKALVIGAGQMSELAIKHLLSAGFEVSLTNRTSQKAKDLVQNLGLNISIESYADLENLINNYKVIISATSSSTPVITKSMVKEVNFNRYWFDIAVPRDIEEMNISNLSIFFVDDLQSIINKNMSTRARQAKTAYSIVSKMSLEFFHWLKSLEIEPIIKQLYLKGNEVIDKKMTNAIKKGFIKVEDEENIRKLCETILTEYLHTPSKQLKNISKNMQCNIVANTLKNIFSLDEEKNTSLDELICEHLEKN